VEFGNQIEYVMSYSINKIETTLKMAFEAILGGVNFLVDPLILREMCDFSATILAILVTFALWKTLPNK
jgi:hypothetical protein